MKKVRTPDEIQLEITHLEWKLRELREEFHISDAVNNPNDFYIYYPDNLTIIEESEVTDKIFEMLSIEFEECF